MRILVVEDFTPLRKAMVQSLAEEGYAVDESAEGDDGLWRAQSGEYDVLVLDLMLPSVNGLEILKQLREDGSSCAVLIVTARDSIEDRVNGLDLGADDYLVKPFAIDELLARVRALLRRQYDRKSPVIRIGALEIHTAKHEVRVDGEPIEFTAREYALLEYLAAREGEVVSRTEIWEHLYDDRTTVASNVVDVYIGYLRKKIERPGKPKLLRTRRGEGYVLSSGETC